MLNRAVRIGIIPVILLAAFVLSGCSKEEVALSEMQNKLNEQQAQVDELQKSKDEQQKKIEEQQATIDELQKLKETPTNEVKPTATRSVADEVYCQTNANKYSTEALSNRKKRPDNEKDLCEDIIKKKNPDTDCDKVFNDARKDFKEYESEYDLYHKKCG